jgi:hypothetical protein
VGVGVGLLDGTRAGQLGGREACLLELVRGAKGGVKVHRRGNSLAAAVVTGQDAGAQVSGHRRIEYKEDYLILTLD